MSKVKLGYQGLLVSTQGLGCMGMSAFYGTRKPESEMIDLIRKAVEMGVTFLDTADVYGPHTNEILVGKAIAGIRDKVQVATKFGISSQGIKGDPAYVRESCEASLKRLGISCIDLYYQHRVDTSVPIEITVGEMKKLVEEGKKGNVLEAFNVIFTGGTQEAMAEQAKVIVDNAKVLSPSSLQAITQQLQHLESQTSWRVRVLTTLQPLESSKQLKQLWETDDRTIVVVEDVTSPNVLAFSTGAAVSQQLPRQFFLELQSRFGNQFYVKQEGESQALLSTLGALQECLSKAGGCRNVPGLTYDLYYLTLATSIAEQHACPTSVVRHQGLQPRAFEQALFVIPNTLASGAIAYLPCLVGWDRIFCIGFE